MADGMYRIGIVGATTLLGKELSDELQDSLLAASDFVLLDDEAANGQIASVSDEAALVQQIEETSFDRMDFVFFAGDPASTIEHWQAARRAGAGIVDMSYALEREAGVPIRGPLLAEANRTRSDGHPNLETAAVVCAHPAAVMLGLVAARIQASLIVSHVAATLMEPASEYGREAMDELHQQTVDLLSFKDLPRAVYDAQVAFNLLPALGEAAKVNLGETEARIYKHYSQLGGGLPPLTLQLVQAPVFHGYVASVLVDLQEPATVAEMEQALVGDSIDLVAEDSDPPSNLSAAGQEDIMVRMRVAGAPGSASRRFWLLLAADNLKLTALNAIACANELRRLRPSGKVQ